MTRTQTVLVLALALVAAFALSQALWDVALPAAWGVFEAVPAFVGSVPGWVWWVALGLALSMRNGGCCGRRPLKCAPPRAL